MIFAGRWVPMDLMNNLFILWLIAAVIVLALIVYLNHRPRRNRPGRTASHSLAPGRRRRRKRHA